MIAPLFPGLGITRIADITWLDEFGVPTWQAVRPLGLSLSVSQGKGISEMLAKVSAAMECIESHHAEHLSIPSRELRLRDAASELTYDPYKLPLASGSVLHDGLRLEWVDAVEMTTGASTLVPRAIVDQDFTVGDADHPVFHRTSSGLASGNTREEAIVHALCELIERDCLARTPENQRKKYGGVDDRYTSARVLCETVRDRGGRFTISDVTNEMGIPVYSAQVWSPTYAVPGNGSGCHLNPEIALCRAITESTQTRLIAISGARDDLDSQLMDDVRAHQFWDDVLPDVAEVLPFDPAMDKQSDSFATDADNLAGIIARHTGHSPLLVDLTPPGYPIAVVKVIGPGLKSLK